LLTSFSEHRQREKNLIKFLEQDVVVWRQKIAALEEETVSVQAENDSLKTLVSSYNIRITASSSPPSIAHRRANSGVNTLRPQKQQDLSNLSLQRNPSPTTTVSVSFDANINFTCLHLQEQFPNPNQAPPIDSPDIFNFPLHNPQQTQHNPQNTTTISHSSQTHSHQELLAEIAVNFILA
jgi:hypothetical protein